MQLTVDRTELITALTEKRTEVAARYEKVIGNIEARISEITPAETAEGWFRAVADLLKDGEVHADQQNGMSYGGGRGDEAMLITVRAAKRRKKGEDPVLPQFPRHNDQQRQYLERDLKHAQSRLAAAVEPYDGALKILNMSSDDKVGIGDGDYAGLLAGKKSRRDFDAFDEYEDDENDD